MAQSTARDGMPAGEAQTVDYSPEGRRADLRRALSVKADDRASDGDKRRLSAEERSALHRDLRAAMKGAYSDAEVIRQAPR